MASRMAQRSLCGCLLFAGAVLAACGQDGGGMPRAGEEVPVRVDRIAIDDNDLPVVVLEEKGGPRWLPIWIGPAEARSIALEMESQHSPRPNTHDLTRSVIHKLHGRVHHVVVTELRGGTYYAVLGISLGDQVIEIDARPSDAIAIALRDGAPIFVRDELFAQGGVSEEPGSDQPKREI